MAGDRVPEAEGGLDLGMVELAVLCEEIGRRLVAAPYLSTIVALGAMRGTRRGGRRDQGLAEALGEGAAVGCVAAAPGPGA